MFKGLTFTGVIASIVYFGWGLVDATYVWFTGFVGFPIIGGLALVVVLFFLAHDLVDRGGR